MRKAPARPASAGGWLVRTNADLLVVGSFLAWTCLAQQHGEGGDADGGEAAPDGSVSGGGKALAIADAEVEVTLALLYPWMTQAVAVLVYYLLSRYAHGLPYAAAVFLLGFLVGYAPGPRHTASALLRRSASLWMHIDDEVLLLVFLPGLIFEEAFTLKMHMFFQCFWQLILFAFPMVLAGSVLTAAVAMHLFPYGWGLNLSLILGAILSGTDPIAVSGLLSSLGAPPRLQIHIGGESLLNDGMAVVLFNIFAERYVHDLGIPGEGEDIGLASGLALFCRMGLGGCATGLAFGIGTVFLLRMMNRELSSEEGVVQVCLLVSVAYLTYFVAEIVGGCSGIIATIAYGLTAKLLGKEDIHDLSLALNFFEVLSHLLNTLLFMLGGTLYGNIMSLSGAYKLFGLVDWGYLGLLFVCLVGIRFLLVFAFYPLTSRIGLGTDVRESIFMGFAGFRGGVGIALALSLFARVKELTEGGDMEPDREVDMLFCMTGGISLFTLLFIGVASKPVLQGLKLATPEKIRDSTVDYFKKRLRKLCLRNYVRLLSQDRFKGVEFDFALVQEYVPALRDIHLDDVLEAARWHKSNTPGYLYHRPALEHVLPYLLSPSQVIQEAVQTEEQHTTPAPEKKSSRGSITMLGDVQWGSVFGSFIDKSTASWDDIDFDKVDVARLNFIELLRAAYHRQVERGELYEEGDTAYTLFQSLEFAEDAAAKGLPLNDWNGAKAASATRVVIVHRFFDGIVLYLKDLWSGKKKHAPKMNFDGDLVRTWMLVYQALGMLKAHRNAQLLFRQYFASNPPTAEEQMILDESRGQMLQVEEDLNQVCPKEVDRIKGRFFCLTLLKESKQYVKTLHGQGILPGKDADEMLAELNKCIDSAAFCVVCHGGGTSGAPMWQRNKKEWKLELKEKAQRLRQLPGSILEEFDLNKAIADMSNPYVKRKVSNFAKLDPGVVADESTPLLG